MRRMASRGSRINRQFLQIHVDGLWYREDVDKWLTIDEAQGHDFSNCKRCRTYRAFKRFCRKHPQFRGKIHLVSRYVGHDIYA